MNAIASVTPLTTVMERVRRTAAREAAPEALRIELLALDDGGALAALAARPDREPTLVWGLSRSRIRVGPLLNAGDDGCAGCLAYWLEHNRPTPELWNALPGGDAPAKDALPWHPVIFTLLESVSGDLLRSREARSFVDIDPDTLRIEAHRYLPAPGCAVCATAMGPTTAGPRDFGPAPKRASGKFRAVDLSVGALRRNYLDYRVGLVSHMYRDGTSSLLPMWGAEAKVQGTQATEIGFGRHEIAAVAESVAVLEALERFCGHRPPRRASSIRASYRDLRQAGEPAVDPEDFILCAAGQRAQPGYRLAAYGPDLVFDWIWGFSCRRRAPVLVPRQMAYYGPGLTPLEELFVLETSNGCALGGGYEEAVFHGLLEVIERDAYMTRWHVKGRPQRLDLGDAATRRLAARSQVEGYELYAFDIGLEIPVPTVLAMIVDPAREAPVASYCASGAHPSAAAALSGALVEICSSIGVYQRQFGLEREQARALLADPLKVQSIRDHVLLYSLPEALGRLDFLDRDLPARALEAVFAGRQDGWDAADLTTDLERLVRHVLDVADDVIVVDQTSEVLAPLGLACVKVLAPGLHPVTFGHQYRRISRRRLTKARRHLEAKGERCARVENPHPHNFP